MSPRLQRLLTLLLIAYFILFGGTVYTENNPTLRTAHQVITAALFFAWLVDLWRSGRGFPTTPLDAPLLAYLVARVLAAGFALDPRVSLESLWQTLTHLLAFYLLVDLLRRGRQRWVIEGLFLTAGVVVMLSAAELFAWYTGYPLAPQFVQGWPEIGGWTLPPTIHRLSLALTVATWVGNFAAVLIPLAAAWALTAKRRDLRRALWLLSGGLLLVLLLSQSRGALLGFAGAMGVWLLITLLRTEVRARFPARLRPLLERQILLGGAAVVGVVALGLVFWLSARSARSGDVNRLDLWESAVEMARDYPVLGVGPRQYSSALRWYGEPELSQSQDHLLTAHNLPLHTLAETGLVGLATLVWLGLAVARLLWRTWHNTYKSHQHRLEGVLAALVVFGIHNLVDTFPQSPQWLPVIVVLAYSVAGRVTRSQAVLNPPPVTRAERRLVLAALAVLLVAQAALVPVHVAELAHARALSALGADDYTTALAETRAAHAADPWLDFYPIHEAYILGRLADDDPASYLEAAITAHEDALALNPTWDTGWHNLAGLYSQAGRYADAITAAETAITWNPIPAGYWLNLGLYHEQNGDSSAASEAYFEALCRSNSIRSSGFWSDPAHPERANIPAAAIATWQDDAPQISLAIAVAQDDLDTAVDLLPLLPDAEQTRGVWLTLAQLALDAGQDHTDYLDNALAVPGALTGPDYTQLAALLLETDIPALDLTAEQAARTARFLGGPGTERANFVLSELAQAEGVDAAAVDSLLIRSVPPLTVRLSFGLAVYHRTAGMGELPQARTPSRSADDLAPWRALAERYAARGNLTGLRSVYEALLYADPYLWDARMALADLEE